MIQLKIGVSDQDGTIVVLNEDRLCYQVLSKSKGAVGVRTISKKLLDEWVVAVRDNPGKGSRELREQLCGKSEIDKFEYGYAATLKCMAEMVLGFRPVKELLDFDALVSSGVRFWTYAPGEQASYFDEVVKAKVIALSYKEIGDYSKLGDKESIEAAVAAAYNDGKDHVNVVRAVLDFRDVMKPGDYVFAKKGMSKFLGVGRVTGGFYHDENNAEYPNRRAIEWLKVEEHSIEDKADRKTLTDVTPYPDFVKKLLNAFGLDRQAQQEEALPSDADRLTAALKQFKKCRGTVPTYDEPESWHGAAKTQFENFVSQNAKVPHAVSWYLDAEMLAEECPDMTPSRALSVMMKVRPAEFATYSPMIDGMLIFAGLAKEPFPTEITIESYEANKALQGQVLAKMHEFGIGKAADDDSPADYLTVNEFAWWLSDEKNKNLVKEKVMEAKWKKVEKKEPKEKGVRTLKDAFGEDEMLRRLAAALRTKPFAILAGHSGTGKSQLVRRLAYMTCNDQSLIDEGVGKSAPGNYCMVQVKPNWHDSTELLGYYSDLGGRHYVNTPFVRFVCKAYAHPDTPFFVCLDEMNLAPVEQYFAEYLSAIESLEKKGEDWVTDALVEADKTDEQDENGNFKVDLDIVDQIMKGQPSEQAGEWIKSHGLTIPKNLFVVGTVNMDETTCQFSRKVLDRAMTLLMNKVDFSTMGASGKPSDEKLLDEAGVKFFREGGTIGFVGEEEKKKLGELNKPLDKTAFVVAYRFANEYALYEEALALLTGKCQPISEADAKDAEKLKTYRESVSQCAEEALDHCVLMKLLPRIHGMKSAVEKIFKGDGKEPGLIAKVAGGLSAEMMEKILDRTGDDYLTFWP